MTEKELLETLKQHDQNALVEVFERYSDKIYLLAVRLLDDEVIADGVVQDTFIALIENIDSFEGRSKLSTWLYRVAYNNAMGRLRKLKPQLELDDLDDNYTIPTTLVDWQTIPETMLSDSEAMVEIHRAIDTLSPTLKAVFLLRDIEELSTEETAESLDISVSAVKVRLHRARLALRETLSNYFEERLIKE